MKMNIVDGYCTGCRKINAETGECTTYPKPDRMAKLGCMFSPVVMARLDEQEKRKKQIKKVGQQKQKKRD
jgi:hypothetical protein